MRPCFVSAMMGLIVSSVGSQQVTLTIVYNNVPHTDELTCDWGFGAVVQVPGETILFDTGSNGNILLSNLAALNIEPADIDVVVISHAHGDHTGGLEPFLAENPAVTVYVPEGFLPRRALRRDTARSSRDSASATIYEETKAFREIVPHVWVTGPYGSTIREQALAIETAEGLVMLTGCSHPGVDTLAHGVVHELGKPIRFVTGGFHLGGASTRCIRRIISELRWLEVQQIGPSHCTGDQARELFRVEWGTDFLEAGCGAVFSFPH